METICSFFYLFLDHNLPLINCLEQILKKINIKNICFSINDGEQFHESQNETCKTMKGERVIIILHAPYCWQKATPPRGHSSRMSCEPHSNTPGETRNISSFISVNRKQNLNASFSWPKLNDKTMILHKIFSMIKVLFWMESPHPIYGFLESKDICQRCLTDHRS